MDVKDALINKGYYFDRCVDLYFYDDQKNLLGSLVCPPSSFKPSITVKGEFIEGEYAISSYISIQNMSYDVDVNAVAYIDCHMYYGGLKESTEYNSSTVNTKSGHSILFSVLYCDQEKEPPNRAVRFQCTVAAQDKVRFNYKMVVLPEGKIVSGLQFKELPENKKKEGSGSKKNVIEAKLIDVLKTLADSYNEITAKSTRINNENSVTASKINEKLMIESIVCDSICSDWNIRLVPSEYTIGGLLRKLNTYETDKSENKSCCRWKISINSNTMNVTTIVPENWKEVAEAKGNDTPEKQLKYYRDNFVNNTYFVFTGENWKQKDNWSSESSTVFLNYVKSAYRTENIIYCTTIYDDRIRPGTFCVIQGNAIMGRHSGKGGKSGSRLIHLTNQIVQFRVTGGVNFEFSTTEGSLMSLVGYITDEDWDPSISTTVNR